MALRVLGIYLPSAWGPLGTAVRTLRAPRHPSLWLRTDSVQVPAVEVLATADGCPEPRGEAVLVPVN